MIARLTSTSPLLGVLTGQACDRARADFDRTLDKLLISKN